MAGNKLKDYYSILQVARNSSQEVIKAAYKALVVKYHPDNNKGFQEAAAAKLTEINEAYSVLSNPETKHAYDVKLYAQEHPSPQPEKKTDSFYTSSGTTYTKERWSGGNNTSRTRSEYSSSTTSETSNDNRATERKFKTSSQNNRNRNQNKKQGVIPVIVGVILIIFCFVSGMDKSATQETTAKVLPTQSGGTVATQTKPQKKYIALTPPNNGKIYEDRRDEMNRHVQLVTIETSGQNCFVKFETKTGFCPCKIYVAKNNSASLDLPNGEYYIKYACGGDNDKWYGYEDLFGENTIYTKTELVTVEGSWDYNYEYTYTLYQVANGNMSSQRIDPKDF